MYFFIISGQGQVRGSLLFVFHRGTVGFCAPFPLFARHDRIQIESVLNERVLLPEKQATEIAAVAAALYWNIIRRKTIGG